jgi:hypothetical protein
MKRIIGVAALAVIASTTAACGSSGSGAGSFVGTAAPASSSAPAAPSDQPNYNDPDQLAKSVAETVDAKQTDGSHVDVNCIHISGHQFSCIGVWSDGSPNTTATVTVSADGTGWISS